MAAGALAQDPPLPVHLSGLINDYTPETGVGGPWEIRGEWSLDIKGDSGTANFSAAVNMTHSDFWVIELNGGNADDNSAKTGRHPHTHHITITDGVVNRVSDTEFTMSGPVFVTADGSPAPFMPHCTPSTPCTLTVDITGGTSVQFSNITLTFGGPSNGPTSHFGTQPIHGVVVRSSK
ncbi:MAG TPA: hypothetical protein VI216_08025 [Candidatus Acidoferrales bacterium]